MKLFAASSLLTGWRIASIEEVCERVTSGGTPSRRQPAFYGGSIPWVKTQELTDQWLSETEEHLTEAGLQNSSAKLLPQHTVLMAMYGATVGRLGILAKSMTCNQAACAMIVDANVADFRFLYYQLLLARHQIIDLANGAAQQNLSSTTIKSLELPLPPLAEQRGIAATLGALDDKIESNGRANGVIYKLLDARALRLGSELPTVALGKLVGSSTETVNPRKLGVQVVDHFSLPAFDSLHMPERITASKIMSNKLAISATCILISRLNPRVNRTWLAIPEPGIPALASTEFLCVLPGGRVELGAIWLALRDEYFISELRRRVTGTSGSHQRVRPADALAIEVPDVRMIDKAEKLETTALLEIAYQKQVENQRLSRLRDTLLPELLSGRIRVSEAQEVVGSTV